MAQCSLGRLWRCVCVYAYTLDVVCEYMHKCERFFLFGLFINRQQTNGRIYFSFTASMLLLLLLLLCVCTGDCGRLWYVPVQRPVSSLSVCVHTLLVGLIFRFSFFLCIFYLVIAVVGNEFYASHDINRSRHMCAPVYACTIE